MLKKDLTGEQYRLYRLVWSRFVACQMADAILDTVSADIVCEGQVFRASGHTVAFPGFTAVYEEGTDDEKKQDSAGKPLPRFDQGDKLTAEKIEPSQHFTQPPAHYTEATLVKTLEELGIGRPSTYAPTISTIIARRYVAKENKNLYLTEIGEVVNHIMKQSFPSIVDVNFTANMESLLDGVAEGKVRWKTIIENFYPDLEAAVEKAEKELSRKELLLSEKNRKLQLAVFVTGLIAVILIALYVLYVRKNHMYRQLVILYDTHRQRERQLLEQRDEKTDLVNTSQKNKALFDAVEKLMNDEHLYRSNSISIDMLVERLHSNRTYLSRMFTEQNTSFSEYINSYRIREALALLSEPENDIPLKVLSDSLGYNSLSSFYRAFQKEMGVPPSRFRQEIKKLHLDS